MQSQIKNALKIHEKAIEEEQTEKLVEETCKQFTRNLNQISNKLIELFQLASSEEETSQHNFSIHRWLDFRFRYIDPNPRHVFVSTKLETELNGGSFKQYDKICQNIKLYLEKGININGLQGRGLSLNDINHEDGKKRTDQLYAHWRIHHLHLSNYYDVSNNTPPHISYSERTKDLLFCIITKQNAYLIDIISHDFINTDLIETAQQNWPDLYPEQKIVRGTSLTRDQIKNLRSNGYNTYLEINGRTYIEQFDINGVMSNGLAIKAFLSLEHALHVELPSIASQHINIFQNILKISNPNLTLSLSEYSLEIHEENCDLYTAYESGENNNNFMLNLQEIFAPHWVLEALTKSA